MRSLLHHYFSGIRSFPVWLIVAMLGLTGCYTQLATMEPAYDEGLDFVEADYERDGDVVVRKYYDDGTVDEDFYPAGYDWYRHEPYAFSRYFSSFYGPSYGGHYFGGCGYFSYCDPYYDSFVSVSFGYGRPYSAFGFGFGSSYGYGGYGSFGYSSFGYGAFGYSPFGYAHIPTYAFHSPYYFGHGGSLGTVHVVDRNYGPRGSSLSRSALTSTSTGTRGGRDNGGSSLEGTRGVLTGSGSTAGFGERGVVSTRSGSS